MGSSYLPLKLSGCYIVRDVREGLESEMDKCLIDKN